MEEQRFAVGPSSGPARHAAQQEEQQQQHQSTVSSAPEQHGQGQRIAYSDEFMMYVFKVEMCRRVDKHVRERCPYAHPGELARRRHPSLYQALPCPEARAKKICPRLENCNCSHSTFEFWLHPDRYKTFLCERGSSCTRPICFFAHSPEELRDLPQGLQRTQPAPRLPASAPPSSTSSSARLEAPAGPLAAHHTVAQQPSGQWGPAAAAGVSGAAAGSSSWHPGQQQQQQQQLLPEQQGQASVPAAASGSWQGPAVRGAVHRPSMLYAPADRAAGSAAGSRQPGGQVVRPDVHRDVHRGMTVAVIPAGPSVWEKNPLLQPQPGEAPTLEELCAAVAQMNMQQGEGPGGRLAVQQAAGAQEQPAQSQLQQPRVVPGMGMMQHPLPVLGVQQMPPGMPAVPVINMQRQQQVMLPTGQLVLMPALPQGEGTAADPSPWGGLPPGA